MTMLRCITGSETFREGSASLLVSLMHTPDKPLEGKRDYAPGKGMFISKAAKAGLHSRELARPIYLPAANNGVSELGSFWDGNFEVEDGVILKVYARRRVQFGSRPMIEQGVVFIQVRAQAPLNRLILNRIPSDHSTRAPVIIEGRFDILTLREAGAAKVALTPDDLSLSKPDKVRAVMDHVEVSPAIKPKGRVKVERVIDHSGAAVTVTTTRTRRPIDLG